MPILYATLTKLALILLGLGAAYLALTRLGMKKFFLPLLILVLGASLCLLPPAREETPPPLTPEQRSALILEQMTVADWYDAYKKDIEHMDNNWQQYHKTLRAFKNDEISIQTVYMRFLELRQKTALYRKKYETARPPGNLGEANETLVAAMLEKTRQFATQQDTALQQSTDAIAPQHLKTDEHAKQAQLLERIMVLESPANLDIAAEISQIRENLTLPGES